MKYNISKSKYCSSIQCPKILWLKENRPNEFDASVLNQAVLDAGSAVGDLAMGLFGEFVEVPYSNSLNEMVKTTSELINNRTPIIAEASFSIDGLFCSVDILKLHDNNEVELYEVKSTTSMKEHYYHDAAFQFYVLSKSGYKVRSCNLVYLNNKYERVGKLELDKLFIIENITAEVQPILNEVESNIEDICKFMEKEEEPEVYIGPNCFEPHDCGFFKYCTRDLPTPNVFNISRLSIKSKCECYRNEIVSFEDLYNSDKLNPAQLLQVKHHLYDCESYVEVESIRDFIKKLYYPLYFLDFESFQPAIPLYDKSHPYEQIVFQYSLHYIEQEGGELKHKEFLACPGEDPRRKLAEQLCKDIPLNVCTTAYNMGFEKGRIKTLAQIFPDLSAHLMNIHDNIVDLMVPFQRKWYYSKAMQGSYSIKYVLPALFPADPALNYQNLIGVHNGGEASAAFAAMQDMSEEKIKETRKQLLEYCKLDTFAMVKLWEKLNNI